MLHTVFPLLTHRQTESEKGFVFKELCCFAVRLKIFHICITEGTFTWSFIFFCFVLSHALKGLHKVSKEEKGGDPSLLLLLLRQDALCFVSLTNSVSIMHPLLYNFNHQHHTMTLKRDGRRVVHKHAFVCVICVRLSEYMHVQLRVGPQRFCAISPCV